MLYSAFSALTLFIECQEEHLAHKNVKLMMRCWHHYLSGWSKVHIVCKSSSQCHFYPKTPSSLNLIKILNGFVFLVLAFLRLS